MNERPIIFSGEMVRAILDGRKTQTRRVVKGADVWVDEGQTPIKCPYGKPGDLLWVRETFKEFDDGDMYYKADYNYTPIHADDEEPIKWTPSIYMPRSASRITLRVKDVRVERVQEITGRDACKEGIQFRGINSGPPIKGNLYKENIQHFRALWDSINAKRGYGWDKKPWVWVVEFERWVK